MLDLLLVIVLTAINAIIIIPIVYWVLSTLYKVVKSIPSTISTDEERIGTLLALILAFCL